jgi:bacterioferritin (cytochrome b1)|tara:strand:+ start:1796 stop:2926 length:1131 start_codon:yes stop_codon:yes gene_type:complete
MSIESQDPVENTIGQINLSKHANEDPLDLFDPKYQMELHVARTLDTNGELPAAEYDNLYNHINERRLEFIDGDKKTKALVTRDLNAKAEAVKEYKAFRQDLAAAFSTKQLMARWADGQQGQAVMALLRDEPRLVQKICPENLNCTEKDELGVVMPDFKVKNAAEKRMQEISKLYGHPNMNKEGEKRLNETMEKLNTIVESDGQRWVSISNLKKMIRLKDNTSKDVLTTMGNNWLAQSAKVNPMDNLVFNQEAAERHVRAGVIKKSTNKQSLAYDEMIPGRIFYEDIQEKIMKTTPYKDPEDAKKIADSIINDPRWKDKLEDELTTYYTGYLKNQWMMGEKNRPRPTMSKQKDIVASHEQKGRMRIDAKNKYVPGSL